MRDHLKAGQSLLWKSSDPVTFLWVGEIEPQGSETRGALYTFPGLRSKLKIFDDAVSDNEEI
jgi:hypothetical protein